MFRFATLLVMDCGGTAAAAATWCCCCYLLPLLLLLLLLLHQKPNAARFSPASRSAKGDLPRLFLLSFAGTVTHYTYVAIYRPTCLLI
jgi:hypothetical protein